jgi:hypothetical protein
MLQAVLKELDQAPLFMCDKGVRLTSKDNRIKPTNLCTKLVSSLRDALGAECCLLNAGEYTRDMRQKVMGDQISSSRDPSIARMAKFGQLVVDLIRHLKYSSPCAASSHKKEEQSVGVSVFCRVMDFCGSWAARLMPRRAS